MKEKESSAAKCPLRHLGEVFGGKWKLPILCILTEHGPKRYSAIKRGLAGVTNVMLTQSLRELEEHGLVHRTQYNEVPPRVEYSLTEKGRKLKIKAVAIPPAIVECMGLTAEEFGALYTLTYKALKHMEERKM